MSEGKFELFITCRRQFKGSLYKALGNFHRSVVGTLGHALATNLHDKMKISFQIAGSTAMIACGVVSCVAGGVLYWWSLFEKDRGDRLSSIKQLKSLAGMISSL
jgi:hypothetical protein